MKKISYILLAALGLAALSCNKTETPSAPVKEQNLIHKTFTVNAPSSDEGVKTELSADGSLVVNWSEDDAITVIGVTADGTATQHTFTITSGQGSPSASFSGTVGEDETTFYAFYPASVTLDLGDSKYPFSGGNITVKQALAQNIPAVENGFNAGHAMMTAVENDGAFTFRHGVAFFKIKVGVDDIASIKFQASNGRPGGRPSFNVSTGATTDIQSAKDNVTLVADGTFTKDGIYFVPVQTKQTNFGTLTLTFTRSDGATATIATTVFSSKKLQSGLVYDLKCPIVSFEPEINADDVSLEADATEGAITYTITRPADGGVMRAALKESCDWLSIGAASEGSVSLTTTVNTGQPRSAVVTLNYLYGDNKVVSKDVTVSQKASGTIEYHEYFFYIDSSKKVIQTKDGSTCTYFTSSGGTADLGGDYKISSWTLNGITSTKGWKLNSSGSVKFTTSGTLNSTVEFWFIRRKVGDTTATIQLLPTGGTATILDSPYDSIGDSGVIELAKSTEYTIKQDNKEQALLMIKVTESE